MAGCLYAAHLWHCRDYIKRFSMVSVTPDRLMEGHTSLSLPSTLLRPPSCLTATTGDAETTFTLDDYSPCQITAWLIPSDTGVHCACSERTISSLTILSLWIINKMSDKVAPLCIFSCDASNLSCGMSEMIKHISTIIDVQKQWTNVFFLCFDRKLTQKLHSTRELGHFMTATTHGIFILKHNLSFDCSSISQACSVEALCGADLTRLVSARFIFPPSTGVWSALSSAQTPWCSTQSIKSISVSCCLGDTGWQPEWACSSPTSSSSPCATCRRSLAVGFLSYKGRQEDVFSLCSRTETV